MSESRLDRAPSDAGDGAVAAEPAPYVPPTLTAIGTLAELTRGGDGASGADISVYVS